jgi:hypothetical protein
MYFSMIMLRFVFGFNFRNSLLITKYFCYHFVLNYTAMWRDKSQIHLSLEMHKHMHMSLNIYKHIHISLSIHKHIHMTLNIYKHIHISLSIHKHIHMTLSIQKILFSYI